MKDKLKKLFLMIMLALMLAPLASLSANAKPPKESFDDACCDALIDYVRCVDSDPSYKKSFKRECPYLGSKSRSLSLVDLEKLAEKYCDYYPDGRPWEAQIDAMRISEVNSKD